MKTKITLNEDKLLKDIFEYMNNNNVTMSMLSKLSGVDKAMISKILNRKAYRYTNAKHKIIVAIGNKIEDYYYDGICIYLYNDINFDELSICELNEWIDKLKKLRDKKCKYELDKLTKEQEYYKQLLKEET